VPKDTPTPRISDEARAANILVRAGAQFIDDALRDNPAGPIRMHAEISRTEIVYGVVIGAPSTDGTPSSARCIWHRSVKFGANGRHVAGGAAFVEAARQQETIAWAAYELLGARR
jgi:hypothetical protein